MRRSSKRGGLSSPNVLLLLQIVLCLLPIALPLSIFASLQLGLAVSNVIQELFKFLAGLVIPSAMTGRTSSSFAFNRSASSFGTEASVGVVPAGILMPARGRADIVAPLRPPRADQAQTGHSAPAPHPRATCLELSAHGLMLQRTSPFFLHLVLRQGWPSIFEGNSLTFRHQTLRIAAITVPLQIRTIHAIGLIDDISRPFESQSPMLIMTPDVRFRPATVQLLR